MDLSLISDEKFMEIAEKICIEHLITKVYPSGVVSLVCDTYDFWKVLVNILPKLKNKIEAREGRVVIRPDSSPKTPVEIICGDDEAEEEHVKKGAYELLWDIFGGTINEKGYKELNPKIGMIYGDSITLDRQKEILKRLEAKGFSASNLVLGIGSYTYEYVTRDTFGFAMKATWGQINGKGVNIFKDPKTDNGLKKSAMGLLAVDQDCNLLENVDEKVECSGLLKTVFENGKLIKETSLKEIRERLNGNL